MHGKANDTPCALVHDDHHPMCIQDERFTTKKIHAPQTVFAMAEERQPRRTTMVRISSIMPGEHSPYRILVDKYAECRGKLVGYPSVAEAWIPALHLHDRCNEVRRWAFRAGQR